MIFTYLLFALLVLNGLSASDFNSTSKSLTVPENLDEFLSSLVVKGKSKSNSPKLQISNGKTATNTQFPFVAELTITNLAGGQSLCSASLIGTNWLLTAKHCIPTNVKSILASFGSADKQSTTRTKIFVDRSTFVGAQDIAILHLVQAVPLSSTIKVIRLPGIPKENFGYENYGITTIGWGLTKLGTAPPRFLQYTYFNILPKTQCNMVNAYEFCCLPPAGGSSVLGGDSGGPSVIVESDGIETLVGVNIAYNDKIVPNRSYQIMTRVSNFLRWIQQETGIVYKRDSLVIPTGEKLFCLAPGYKFYSASGCYYLYYQTDGNIVIYSKSNAVIWASNTAGKATTRLCMQPDGNLVLYNSNTPVWSTGTFNYPGAYAKLQNDASLAIFKTGTTTNPVWKTKSLTTFPTQC